MNVALGAGFRRFLQLGIDRRAVGFLVFEPPEIEAADAVGLEGLRQLDAMIEQCGLCLEIEIGVKLIVAWDSLWRAARRANPL